MAHGQVFTYTEPTIVLNGSSGNLGTTKRNVTEFCKQYTLTPSVSNPCTVTISGSGLIYYTFGPQAPTSKPDNITCFKYSGPITLTNNKNQDGIYLMVVAFEDDGSGNPKPNVQSNVVVAKFHVNM